MSYLVKNSSRKPVLVLGRVLASSLSSKDGVPGSMVLSKRDYEDYSIQKLLSVGVLSLVSSPSLEEDSVVEVSSPLESETILESEDSEEVLEEPSPIEEVAIEEPAEAESSTYSEESLTKMSYSKLKNIIKELNISANTRKKTELVKLILESQNG